MHSLVRYKVSSLCSSLQQSFYDSVEEGVCKTSCPCPHDPDPARGESAKEGVGDFLCSFSQNGFGPVEEEGHQ